MNKIEKLIQKQLPYSLKEYLRFDGIVSRQTVESISKKISSGGTPLRSKNEYYNGMIPWLRTQEVDWSDINDTRLKITEQGLKNSSAKLIPINCVIVAMYGATAAKSAINKIPLCTNQACCNIQVNEEFANYKYVFYWFCENYKKLRAMGEGSQFNLNAKKIRDFIIPIPPLEVQEEIVRCLDSFTALEAELKAELKARQQQYHHYRDELLSFDENVPRKTLGEMGEFVRGNGLQKKDFTETGIGCIHYGQIYTYYGFSADKTKSFVSVEFAKKMKKANYDDVIIATTSENIEDVCKPLVWLGHEEVAISGDSCIYKSEMNGKFIAYYLNTQQFFKDKKKDATGTKVIRLSTKSLSKITIPVPPLAEQERIVAILDKFDTLVNDISVGLPAEIEARHKQYEYYRNKLLTFKAL